jgi:hypothetical protein
MGAVGLTGRDWRIAAWAVTTIGAFALIGILQEGSTRVLYNATLAIGVLGTVAALLFLKAAQQAKPQSGAVHRSKAPSGPWTVAMGTGSAMAAAMVLAMVLAAPDLEPLVWLAVVMFVLFMGSFYAGLTAGVLGLISLLRGSRSVHTFATLVLGLGAVLLDLAVFVLAHG